MDLLAPILAIAGRLSLEQWIKIAAALIHAAPQVKQTWQALHPAFEVLVTALPHGERVAGEAGHMTMQEWLKANGDAAIRAQGTDNG